MFLCGIINKLTCKIERLKIGFEGFIFSALMSWFRYWFEYDIIMNFDCVIQ